VSGVRLLDYWSPPDGAGAPVACLATSFTFEADFFTQDCLARFLSLSSAAVAGEGDRISSLAAVLEEEDRLCESQVSVLVDRRTPAEKRNLRWDLLPVHVPGGLLHAKVAALLWERSARIILGSANLTSAGYRRQVELGLAIDLDENCRVTRSVLDELVEELRRLVELAPGPRAGTLSGPKARALATVDLLDARISALSPPTTQPRDLRLAAAPARPGTSPLDRLPEVWKGAHPLWATVLSPFWDGQVPAPAAKAIGGRLTGRPAAHRRLTFVVATDPYTGAVQAPSSLAASVGDGLRVDVVAFDQPDDELRRLHAKLMVFESDEWVAALIGSSNATEAGLGLHHAHGHHELNLWIGCAADSRLAKHLRALACDGEAIDLETATCDPLSDEDEPTAPELPTGFVSCVVEPAVQNRVILSFDPGHLPAVWEVRSPAGHALFTAAAWRDLGSPTDASIDLHDELLPAYLVVEWHNGEAACQATWTANVEDRSALPPPAELAELSVDVLLAALASTRPLPLALEHELRRREPRSTDGRPVDLDPLRRFDDSGLLLQRVRHLSLALWRLQDRLGRPVTSLDALHWRLHGPFGPLAIADGLVAATEHQQALPGEAHFLLAELALTIDAVDWAKVMVGVDKRKARKLVAEALAGLEQRRQNLPPTSDDALDAYAHDAIEKARR